MICNPSDWTSKADSVLVDTDSIYGTILAVERMLHEEFSMTVLSRKPTRTSRSTTRRPTRRISRKPVHTPTKSPVTVYLVRPKGTPAAIERGRRLAEEVRKELAVLDDASLDETMRRMRGRAKE